MCEITHCVHTKVLCHVRSRFCVKCEKFVYTSAATDASDKYQACLYHYGIMASIGLGWNWLLNAKKSECSATVSFVDTSRILQMMVRVLLCTFHIYMFGLVLRNILD